MLREVKYNGNVIKYNLQRKKVKNINLRIKPDLSVNVSANNRVNYKYIDNFVISKAEFILSSLEKFKSIKNLPPSQEHFTLSDFKSYTEQCFEDVYKLFANENINRPQLKFRKMKSRWGSCNFSKGIITISTNMIYCTEEQIYYVMVHEFSHLLVHNHSKDFYAVVSKYCRDYKRIRKELNNVIIKQD